MRIAVSPDALSAAAPSIESLSSTLVQAAAGAKVAASAIDAAAGDPGLAGAADSFGAAMTRALLNGADVNEVIGVLVGAAATAYVTTDTHAMGSG